MMFENEKISILKVEEDFIRQKSDHFLFMLDCVTTQLVTSEQASEDWKRSLKDYCENELNRVKKMTQSHSIANLDSLQAQLPDTFQVNAVNLTSDQKCLVYKMPGIMTIYRME